MSIELAPECKMPFWRRQFGSPRTEAQYTYDIFCGLFLPLMCVLCDPIVFRASTVPGLLRPAFEQYLPFAYLVIVAGWLALASWLITAYSPSVFTGILLAYGILATILGVMLLPLSLIGIFFYGLGILGFSPFLTAFVFVRNAVHAWNSSTRAKTVAGLLLAIGGFSVAIAIPAAMHIAAQRRVHQALDNTLSANANVAALGVSTLKSCWWFSDWDLLVRSYQQEQDEARRVRIANAYLAITGKDIKVRLQRLLDD